MSDELGSRILYCDADCVVVNKIAGEAVEGAGWGMIDLPRLLTAELSASDYPPALPMDALSLPTAVHRLDVPVSGCAAFARSGAALRFLNAAFSADAVEKRYWAIVESSPDNPFFSVPANDSVELVHWIQFNSRRNKSTAYDQPGPGRKKAIIRCRLIGAGQNYQFLEIELITGRHHQIRAQFERLDIHVKGDLKYGARRSEAHGGIRLHARSLSFPDPADNSRRISVQAEPPLRDNLWLAFEAFLP
ncbi:MAG: RNA pseudouridine synthase [Treponema sp.]|jgi:23S rRNA pseudouridine1911/1915/1917 synthase|nr:RNA pseudouridine synthase [Treponema sp.]